MSDAVVSNKKGRVRQGTNLMSVGQTWSFNGQSYRHN